MNKDDSGKFISAQGASPRVAGLCGELQEERVLFDLADPVVLDTLRADAMRMAAAMDDPAEEPPMLWSGVPWPRGEAPLRSDYCLSISVGGSKMVALLLRVEGGEAVGLGPAGEELRGADLESFAKANTRATPNSGDTADGVSMIEKIVEAVCDQFKDHLPALAGCANILLSWGFAGASERTDESLLGGLTVRTTLMTKGQGAFTAELKGRDLCGLVA